MHLNSKRHAFFFKIKRNYFLLQLRQKPPGETGLDHLKHALSNSIFDELPSSVFVFSVKKILYLFYLVLIFV